MRKRSIDERRAVIGLSATVLILIGILLYTTAVPLAYWFKTFIAEQMSDQAEKPTSELEFPLPDEKTEDTKVATTSASSTEEVLSEYLEVIDSCGAHFEGECLRVRSGPGVDYPVVERLRNGMVLKVGEKVETNGMVWYEIVFDEWLRYPERMQGKWYVAADYVKIFVDEGDKTIWENKPATTSQKSIIVDRSEQMVYAYDGEELFMTATTSTGLQLTPTPRGTYTVFKKTPSRYMQGPLPNLVDQQYYDLPGVPWNLYFTDGGAVIHGAYWHNSFGRRYSHGCVNLPPTVAHTLYTWADLGTKVIVKD